jgi:glycogen phosphorylase
VSAADVTPLSTPESFRATFLQYLRYTRGRELDRSSSTDRLIALELAVREVLISRLLVTQRAYRRRQPKAVHYLSMEYLIGRLLKQNLLATGLYETADQALAGLGLDLADILEEEPDPGLGNGGLGRLAACFLESLATLDYPTFGYGLRYDFGIFRQKIAAGWQEELPDNWLAEGFAWEVRRPDLTVAVRIGGTLEWEEGRDGRSQPKWVNTRTVHGVPHDVLIAGHGTETVAVLRLWSAEAPAEFDLRIFSQGDFLRAVAERERTEAISKVLYPPDVVEAGRELRLSQEYFLVACSVCDAVQRFTRYHGPDWQRFPDKVAFQMNDTHPALTVAELMRFFIDEAGLQWEEAWRITRACCGYTNHTLLPEALETWPVSLMERIIPRHVQIIFEINQRFLEEVLQRYPGDLDRMRRMSIVQENGDRRFSMAHLAVVGSSRVNGVAKLHTELLKKNLVRDFAEMWPERFISITNGITPRRWLLACNPRLAGAITERIGDGWTRDLVRLRELLPLADEPAFREEFLAIKRANKVDLATFIEELCGIAVQPDSLFDVQIKRLHEYKRQLLNAMHIIALYLRVKADPTAAITPRTFIFGAKAAPTYQRAKLIIKLINGIADVVNSDPDVAGRLKVAFVPDYRVSLAERIIPAADLSEQISTAGKEASGTGNMKLALNGALTIGTLDGANIEIRDAVGEDNIFIFGLTAEEVEQLRCTGRYDPSDIVRRDPELAAVMETLRSGLFAGGDPHMFRDLWSFVVEWGDPYMHAADFRSYADAQEQAAALFLDPHRWAARAIRNVGAVGCFSSDRAVEEYARQVWGIERIPLVNGGR